MAIPRLYISGTVGGTDGTAVSATDQLGGISSGTTATLVALGLPYPLMVRCASGTRTPSAVTVIPVKSKSTTDYDTDITVSASESGTYSASANIGLVGDTNVAVWVKQTNGKLSESLRSVYLYYAFGGDTIALPAFTVSPSVGTVGSTSITATATANSVTTTQKYLVLPAASAAPAIGDFSATFTSGATITGLTASTSYKLYVALWDADGFYTISGGVAFQTNAGTALSFTSQPAASQATSQGFTVSYAISDSGSGSGVTHWLSTDNGANYTEVTPSGSYPNYTYAVTGKTSGAYNVRVKVISGATTVLSDIVSMSTATLGQVSLTGITSMGTSNALDLSWSAITGASGYRRIVSTSSTAPTNGSSAGSTDVGNVTSVTVSSLTTRTLHYAWVCAYDSAGNLGNWSAVASDYAFTLYTTDCANTTGWSVGGADSANFAVVSGMWQHNNSSTVGQSDVYRALPGGGVATASGRLRARARIIMQSNTNLSGGAGTLFFALDAQTAGTLDSAFATSVIAGNNATPTNDAADGLNTYDGAWGAQLLDLSTLTVGRPYDFQLELKADGKIYATFTDTVSGQVYSRTITRSATMQNIRFYFVGKNTTSSKVDSVWIWY